MFRRLYPVGFGQKDSPTRIHIEEDAGKLVHERGNSFVDYNRGGVPLIEDCYRTGLSLGG